MSIATMALAHASDNGEETPNGKRDSNGVIRATGIVTNFIKLGGLFVVLHEVAFITNIRPIALIVAAFMMAGAQSLDSFLSAFFNPPDPKR